MGNSAVREADVLTLGRGKGNGCAPGVKKSLRLVDRRALRTVRFAGQENSSGEVRRTDGDFVDRVGSRRLHHEVSGGLEGHR